jgi:hypothetical protein
MKIMPNEMFVTEFGALIRTRCPKGDVTDAMVHQRVVAANLAAGDYVKVQAMNHEQTAVLHFCEYLVFDRRTEMKRLEINDREIKQFEDVSFSILKTVDWQATPAGAEADKQAALVAGEAKADPVQAKAVSLEVKWNPGKKTHEVKAPDGTVIKWFDDKAAAEAFAKAS